jgi:hypothetical protein
VIAVKILIGGKKGYMNARADIRKYSTLAEHQIDTGVDPSQTTARPGAYIGKTGIHCCGEPL